MHPAIREQILAQVADGVEKFAPWVLQDVGSGGQVGISSSSSSFQLEAVKKCLRCPLSEGRQGVCVQEAVPVKIFVLAEAPTPLAEAAFFGKSVGKDSKVEHLSANSPLPANSPLLFEGEGVSEGVLGRLISRLPGPVHRSYALKCVPRKSVSLAERRTCAESHLLAELLAAKPHHLFVFGALASQEVQSLLPRINSCVELASLNVMHFPSAEQLEAHSGWRAEVWALIQEKLRR